MNAEDRKVIEQAIDALVRVENVEGWYYFDKKLLAALRSLLEKPAVPLEEVKEMVERLHDFVGGRLGNDAADLIERLAGIKP